MLKALDKGVPFVVTGSDCHKPEDLAKGFEKLRNRDRYNVGADRLLKQDR